MVIGKLGKEEYVHDDRTLMLLNYLLPDLFFPQKFDFDSGRSVFPLPVWGNSAYKNCVIAGEANHLLRLERMEQRHTLALTNDDTISRYKDLTGCEQPGDAKDTGLVVIDAMRNWRNVGWMLSSIPQRRLSRNYTIAAYGELEPSDPAQLRMAAYLLHGIHLGFWLPISAQKMTSAGVWDYNGETGLEWQPGSWGGHLVYCKAYNPHELEILTWGIKIRVTNSFVDRYCDEAWGVVDSLDSWRVQHAVDAVKLTEELSHISGGKINR